MRRVGGAFIVLISKIGFKVAPALLKLAKGLKLGKVGLAAGSMTAYSYLFTWQFAALILLMLFVHESGHLWAMRRCGMKTKGMYFIPLIGAVAVPDSAFPNCRSEAYVAIMGPIWGFSLAVIATILYLLTQNPLWAAVGSWCALINLLNLLPMLPLDGGRIAQAIAISTIKGAVILTLVMAVSIIAALVNGYTFLGVIGCLGLWEFSHCRSRRDKYGNENPEMNSRSITVTTTGYIGAAVLMWMLMLYLDGFTETASALKALKGL